jgi:hypothetical protein
MTPSIIYVNNKEMMEGIGQLLNATEKGMESLAGTKK